MVVLRFRDGIGWVDGERMFGGVCWARLTLLLVVMMVMMVDGETCL